MATFQKRNGRVTATVRIKPHPPKTKTFDTVRDAKAWALALEVKFKNEKAQNFQHIILKDALIEYRDTLSILKKGAKQEINRINYILKHMDCNRSILKVDKQFLVAWRELRLENTKGSTVRRELLMLAGFFTWCMETKLWLSKNPVKEIKLPPASPHRERVISSDEIEKLLPFLNAELKDIFLIALETGMRQSKICNLAWDRVYLHKKYLLLDVTKNGRKREVPLSKMALEILKNRKDKNMKKVFNYLPNYVY
ncbi:MAG: Tyrosine recombinase XerC [Acinetobacter bereziniae]|uniref:Tyrosine recombinase XerC n=1 Tax=Acinetobacter bereziniae TaxID=106648 RepID=A0A833URK7_ACIBZ|nr:MAG: Tyrosine recombinase XerC [Acinetobacter bereziniae]